MAEIIKTNNSVCRRCKYNYGDLGANVSQKGFTESNPKRQKTIGCAYLLDTSVKRISEEVKKAVPESEWWHYCDRFETKTHSRRKGIDPSNPKSMRGEFQGQITKSSERRYGEV